MRDCLNRALAVQDGCAKVTKSCFLCGHCIAVCPAGAVSMDDYDMADVIPFDAMTCTIDPDVSYCRSVPGKRAQVDWR